MSVPIPGLSVERQAADNESKLMEEWGEWNDGLGEILQKNPEPEAEEGVMSVGDIGSQVYEWCKDNTQAVGEQILQYGKRDRRQSKSPRLRPVRRKTTAPKLRPGVNHGAWHRTSLSAGLSKLSSYLGFGGSRRKKKIPPQDDDFDLAPDPPLRRTRSSGSANPSRDDGEVPSLTKSRSEPFQKQAEGSQPALVRSQTWDAGPKRTSSSGRRRTKPLSSVSELNEFPRKFPKISEEVIKAFFCPPYYLWMGVVLMSFVTDNVHDLASFPEERKKLMLVLLALSVVNFFSMTTTKRSNIAFLALRALCDALNVLHAVALLLTSIWAISLPSDLRALATWFFRYPSLSEWLGMEQKQGGAGAVLGVINLLLGLVRVAHDLKIDTNPLLHEVPHMLTGLLLFLLVPCNVADADSAWHANTALPWCKCHVLTTAMAVGLLNLGAPPHRSVGAPLVVMVLTSLWALGVASAGVTMGPAAVPWPGIPLFAILSVVCLLLSKHT